MCGGGGGGQRLETKKRFIHSDVMLNEINVLLAEEQKTGPTLRFTEEQNNSGTFGTQVVGYNRTFLDIFERTEEKRCHRPLFHQCSSQLGLVPRVARSCSKQCVKLRTASGRLYLRFTSSLSHALNPSLTNAPRRS